MCSKNRSPYSLPANLQYHYYVWYEPNNGTDPTFVCGTNKEEEAITIARALSEVDGAPGASYKVRVPASRAHTIFSFEIEDNSPPWN